MFTSCIDKCADVECGNGYCDDGTCNCFDGYYGSHCQYSLEAENNEGGNETGSSDSTILAIGDLAHGGVVFYIDSSGEHGLVCSLTDTGEAEWGCKGDEVEGADGTDIFSGETNTNDILDFCEDSGTAAELTANLSSEGHTDWYLPSKAESYELYLNKSEIDSCAVANDGSPLDGEYWSSTEDDQNRAWKIKIHNGQQQTKQKNHDLQVRAIRAF